jgi:arylsulfatase A-like enzyme
MEVGGGAGMSQNGRDHNPFGFTMWLAGGGIKGGMVYGATDDFGFKAVEKPVHVHDLHATILHLLGIDHTKLTYRYSGRDFRPYRRVGLTSSTTSSRSAGAGALKSVHYDGTLYRAKPRA